MKMFKKVMVFVLFLFMALGLTACSNKAELEALQKQVEDLQSQLDEVTNSKTDLQGQLDATKSSLEEKVKDLLGKLTVAGAIDPECTSMELVNEAAVLGAPSDKGLYYLSVDDAKELEVKINWKHTYDGVEYEFSTTNARYAVDYFWADTEDYNHGVEWDEEAHTLKGLLKGTYGIAIYAYDFAGAGKDYPAQQVTGEECNALYYDVVISEALDLLSSSDEKQVRLYVGGTDQLKLSSAEYEVVSAESTDPSVATVSDTLLVTAVAEGKAAVKVTVKAAGSGADADKRVVTIPVEVAVLRANAAGGANGDFFDLSKSSVDQKEKILAYMERYLINEGASIPVINNSGLTAYSKRVNFLADDYVAQMGYGPMYKAPDTGKGAGTAEDPAYRLYTSADPSTLNHLNYADSVESDFLSLVAGSLMDMGWKIEDGVGTGWEFQANMSALPYPVSYNEGTSSWDAVPNANALTESASWKFDLRHDLKWENGDAINADDFIFTYQQVLNPTLNMKRANYYYGGSTPVKGAKAYFDGETTDWSTVGIKKVDDYSFVVTFEKEIVEWDICYSWSSFLYSPVHKATWEKCLSEDGKSTTYGTTKDLFMASGAYKIGYWEKGKEYRFTKNDEYFAWNANAENVDVVLPAYENISYTIVKDANAAMELFKQGKLDVTGVPAKNYEEFTTSGEYILKSAPGATSFRFSVNKATQAELDAQYGAGAWDAKPILQENDFLWALYFGLDRNEVQKITKTSTGFDAYFTSAYSIVSSTLEGLQIETYRTSEWGQKMFTGLYEGDMPLDPTSLNYNAALATSLYVSAVKNMLEKGVIELGTEANPTVITIEIAAFDGATWEGILQFICSNYNKLFNNTKEFGGKIKFEAVDAPQPGMDVYYVKQMTGQFDLALAGISGGTLDPMGFLEVFCDDNRGGLFLNPGLDTHNANILIDLDLNNDGKNDGAMYWSFDALYMAYNGKTFVKNGCEATAPAEAPAE